MDKITNITDLIEVIQHPKNEYVRSMLPGWLDWAKGRLEWWHTQPNDRPHKMSDDDYILHDLLNKIHPNLQRRIGKPDIRCYNMHDKEELAIYQHELMRYQMQNSQAAYHNRYEPGALDKLIEYIKTL